MEIENNAKSNSQKLFRRANELCGAFMPKLQIVNDSNGNVLEEKKQ